MANKHFLKPPSKEALVRSQQLEHYLVSVIQKEGPLSFATFMEHALYTPDLGYYTSMQHPFGPQGDFVTAPELSDNFSICIAQFCKAILQEIGQGEIVEIGAGSGRMAATLLCALEKQHCLPETYTIVEKSLTLQQYQKATLEKICPHLLPRIAWHQALPQKLIQGIVIGNEFLDALPVHRFQWNKGTFFEWHVGRTQNQFTWVQEKIENPQLLQYVEELQAHRIVSEWPSIYSSEANLQIPFWIEQFSHLLQKGVLLLIDYGFPRHEYYHPDRHMGTLMCHYQQKAHDDPLLYPGLQDITAHIDFTYLAEEGIQSGFEVLGFTNQASFLINCGLLNTVRDAASSTTNALHLLTAPSEMGELFKVMALGRQWEKPLIAFQHYDQRHRLAL